MSTFLPRDLSEIAQRLGCVSQSGMFYVIGDGWEERTYYKPSFSLEEGEHLISAFSFEDFAGTSEQARKNAKIVFGEKIITGCPVCMGPGYEDPYEFDAFFYHVHAMVRSKDWITYIRPFLEGR